MSAPERHIAGRPVGRIGLGAQMLGASTTLSISESIQVVHAALDGGARLIDVADVYAPNGYWRGQGERLVGEALRTWSGPRDAVVVATKGGHLLGAHPQDIARDGRPEHLRAACEASLRAMGVEAIDLYQLHSVDPATPLEDSVGALADLKREGKIRMIGLSNVGRGQIARAREIADIASVQNRLSVISVESLAVLDWCGANGVAFLPYSPLGRAEAGRLGDRLEALSRVAARHSVSPQRAALAWLVSRGDHVLPLPGATRIANVLDNLAAADLDLTPEDLAEIEAAAKAPAA